MANDGTVVQDKYYNGARTHRSLNKDAPVPRAVQAVGRILPTPILGGLHHQYELLAKLRRRAEFFACEGVNEASATVSDRVFLRQITKPNRITHDASARDAIKLLADYSRRSFPLPTGGARTAEREAQAGHHRDRGGADRGLRRRLARPSGSPAQRPPGAVARVCCQGRARSAADQHADRAALRGQELATAVRLGAREQAAR